MRAWVTACLCIISLALGACDGGVWASNSSTPISDNDLRALAARPYNKEKMVDRRVLLGTQNGVKVIADFPCSDICPDYTTRIIHLDVDPGPNCTAADGTEEDETFALGDSNTIAPFCVPKAVARPKATSRIETVN